jgi:hypothetical protein
MSEDRMYICFNEGDGRIIVPIEHYAISTRKGKYVLCTLIDFLCSTHVDDFVVLDLKHAIQWVRGGEA